MHGQHLLSLGCELQVGARHLGDRFRSLSRRDHRVARRPHDRSRHLGDPIAEPLDRRRRPEDHNVVAGSMNDDGVGAHSAVH